MATNGNDRTRRAALYLRVSTEDQAEAYGLDVQSERCEAQAKAKGWTVAREYVDAGISGTLDTDGRPALAELMTDVEAGAIDAVIVLALDRLGRRTALVLELADRISAAGVELVSCKEALDTSTPQGQFVMTLFAGLAQLERDTIVERTTAGRNARGKVDGERGGRVPMGYTRTADGIDVDGDSATTVKRIFRERKAGATLARIAADLNGDGISTPRGGRWHPSSVRIVLHNASAYTGGTRGASAVRWPRIISHQLARAVAGLDGRTVERAA